MAKSYNQKMKILYLMRALLEKTDEEHVLSMSQIKEELDRYDIKAERKSIYDDIEALRLFGLDIIFQREKTIGYYVGKRYFELPELKLLVDAVQSSKFITYKKSRELIKKLESLTSKSEAQQLQRQVFVANRVKTMNESIYYNVDKIHNAITADVKIAFLYYEWTVDKEISYRKNGEKYIISPSALTWDDENYYLIGYDEEEKIIKHFRVDKMVSIDLLEEKRTGKELFENFDAARYTRKTFGMYGGEETDVSILFENHLIGVVIDRFGKDVYIRKQDENHFVAKLNIVVSHQFYGWLAGLGNGAVLVSPSKVVEENKQYLASLLEQYES